VDALGVDTKYKFQVPVGSLVVETANWTLPSGMSIIEANHLPLAWSKIISGSDIEEVGRRKKSESANVLVATVPDL
jgi:hypothetical protein